MVESTIILPLFLLLVFGVIETGWLYYNHSTVQNMSVVGARTGSGEGHDALADHAILRSVAHASSGISNNAIRSVVVYRADGPNERVPEACKTTSVSGTCNHYVAADLLADEDQFGCIGPPGPPVKKDDSWCPRTRKTALEGANGPPDYLGVYVETSGQSLFGVLGSAFTFTTDTVIRLEPRSKT